ncbi:hypothetical protein D3C73_1340540 [compost metagenome]
MTSLFDDQIISVRQDRLHKPALGSNGRQRPEHVDFRDPLGKALQPLNITCNTFTELVKQPVFEIGHLLLRFKDERLLLF